MTMCVVADNQRACVPRMLYLIKDKLRLMFLEISNAQSHVTVFCDQKKFQHSPKNAGEKFTQFCKPQIVNTYLNSLFSFLGCIENGFLIIFCIV